MADIRLKNLVKQYRNGVTAVQSANLEVADGEFLVLVGPSGCGKSTTLRMVAGLEEVTSGDIFIGETRVNDLEPGKRNIAMVFQNYGLYPHMTVRQNMSFGLKMRKTPKADIKQRVQEAAEILSIESLLDRRPRELSGGQQQRVAVGRAIVRKPAAFLFDEPLSNLDAKLRVQMRTELARLHQRLKTTTIYVTHDQVEAMTLGDRIVVMNEGVIQQVDTPMELYHRPANRFVAGFIGSPPMNFVDGNVTDGVFHAGSIRFPIKTAHQGKVTLGFRPEHISIDNRHPVLAQVPLEVVERMGHETMVYCSVPGAVASGADQAEASIASTVIRLDGNADVKAGDQLTLHLPSDRAYLFEQNESGKLIQ